MYELTDLYYHANIVSARLSDYIAKNKLTKSSVCSGAGLSRPTLDKLLNNEITSKTNFEKHLKKLLTYLKITPEQLMGVVKYPFNNLQKLEKVLRLNTDIVHTMSNVSVENIKKFEMGEDIPLIDLRSLALLFGTNVAGLTGNKYFQTDINLLDYFVATEESSIDSPGGFWGHFGFKMKGNDQYQWFPITYYTTVIIHNSFNKKFMVIPTMDNHLLLLNNKYIDEIVLLDEACDAPYNMNWDPTVSCGETPPLVYEAFSDYWDYKEDNKSKPSDYDLPKQLVDIIDTYLSDNELSCEEFYHYLNQACVYFSDKRSQEYFLDDSFNTIPETVTEIYEMGEMYDDTTLVFQDTNGADILLNLNNICMVKLPLALTEEIIQKDFDEF